MNRTDKTNRKYSMDEVEHARSILENIPVETERQYLPMYRVVDELKPMILRLRQSGYSFSEISQILVREGINIKASTLMTYISRCQKRYEVRRTRRTRTQGVSSAVCQDTAEAE